jgi:hypothetical protein
MEPWIGDDGGCGRGRAARRAWLAAIAGSVMLVVGCDGEVSSDPSGTGAGGSTATSSASTGGSSTGGAGGATSMGGAAGGATTTATGTGGGTTGMPCSSDAECAAPDEQCSTAACVEGFCVVDPASEVTPCNGTCHCDGLGSCAGPGCVSDSVCPPSPNACLLSKCVGCEECALVPAPIGTPLPDTAGDCKLDVCNGNGATTQVVSDEDIPDDGDPCTVDLCDRGVPSHAPLCQPGQTCNQGVCSP